MSTNCEGTTVEEIQWSKLTAYVFCGGEGSRLRSITLGKVPKHLLKAGNKTLLELSIEPYINHRLGKVVLVAARHSDEIRKHFEKSDGINGSEVCVVSQEEPHGVRNELLHALKVIPPDSEFFISDGDGVRHNVDLEKLFADHQKSRAIATMTVTAMDDLAQHHGVVFDENMRVREIIPYPADHSIPGNFVYAGLMLCSHPVEFLLNDRFLDSGWWGIFTGLLQSGQLSCVPMTMNYFNVNTPPDYLNLLAHISEKQNGTIS